MARIMDSSDIEKAMRKQNIMQNLTMNYSTDSKENMLSMNYSEIEVYSEELLYAFNSTGKRYSSH